jgi:hypothetical protein
VRLGLFVLLRPARQPPEGSELPLTASLSGNIWIVGARFIVAMGKAAQPHVL